MHREKEQQAGAFAMQRRSRLMAQAVNLCGNVPDAEDLVQEVILRFIQEFGAQEHLPPTPSGEAWLVRTLSNLFFLQCRKLKTQKNGARDPALSAEAREAAPLLRSEDITREQFSEGIGTLSPKIRETFALRANGKKYEDIASLLGIPIGTVKRRLHNGRKKLQKYFQKILKSGAR